VIREIKDAMDLLVHVVHGDVKAKLEKEDIGDVKAIKEIKENVDLKE
jgi:hypothetical protein